MKFMFKSISVVTLLFFLCSCTQTTTGIWNKPTYIESINYFLISPEDKSLIIIGENHHYIFSQDSAPLSILTWSGRKNLRADFSSGFEVDSENTITGKYSINCNCNAASDEEVQWLKINGFQLTKEGLYNKSFIVSGTRYLAGSAKMAKSQHLNNQYSITIKTPHSTGGIIGRAAFTPIAIAEDGVATIGLGALLIIAAPFSLADKITKGNESK